MSANDYDSFGPIFRSTPMNEPAQDHRNILTRDRGGLDLKWVLEGLLAAYALIFTLLVLLSGPIAWGLDDLASIQP